MKVEPNQTLLVARRDGQPGFSRVSRKVFYIDHFGRAKTRGIVKWESRWWIVARYFDPDGWVMEITVEDACKGGYKTLKYRNYLERIGM